MCENNSQSRNNDRETRRGAFLRVWLVTGLIAERGVIAPNCEALAKAFPDRIAQVS
jgi:hypothetical protein